MLLHHSQGTTESTMTALPADTRMPPCANVLGVGIHAVNMNTAVQIVSNAVATRTKGYVCAAGVHGVMEAQRQPDLLGIFENALLVFPDGMPTVWMGRLQGLRGMTRVFGPDLMHAVTGHPQLAGYSHFLLGGDHGVADDLRDSLKASSPTHKHSRHVHATVSTPDKAGRVGAVWHG